MHWLKKTFTYEICIPPIKRPFREMSNEESQAYFDWYMEVMPQRIEYLARTAAAKLKCDVRTFDLSPESLIPLWRWFLTVGEKEPSTSKSFIIGSGYRLSLQSEYIIRDIGMYLGKTFLVNDPSLFWMITKKRNVFYNQPVIDGFYPTLKDPPLFEPIHMAHVQGAHFLFDRASEEDLLKVYDQWEKTAIWNRSHLCPKCGGLLLLKHEIINKDMYVTCYTCALCKKEYAFSEIGVPPDFLLLSNKIADKFNPTEIESLPKEKRKRSRRSSHDLTEHDLTDRPPDIEVLFDFCGQKKEPVSDGYKPLHLVKDLFWTSGLHHYFDVDSVPPGGKAKGTITLLMPEQLPHSLWIGQKIKIHDGSQFVGYATITKIMNPLLQKDQYQSGDGSLIDAAPTAD